MKNKKLWFVLLLSILTLAPIFLGLKLFRKYQQEKEFWQDLPQQFQYLQDKKDLLQNPPVSKKISGFATSIPVLYYHGVKEFATDEELAWDNFKDQLFTLKQNGYQTVTYDQFTEFIEGKNTLPQRSFLLTFDDGRKDSYYPVDPVLKALDYTAVMFVITSKTDKDDFFLSSKELETMLTSGRWEIHSHSKSAHQMCTINSQGYKGHCLSYKQWLSNKNRLENDEEYTARIRYDLVQSKRDLKEKFGVNATGFAIPYGDYGQQQTNFPDAQKIIHMEMESVYDYVFYQPWGNWHKLNYPQKDTFMIKRLGAETDWTAEELLNLLNSYEDKDIDYVDDFNLNNGWYANLGTAEIQDGSLQISATGNSDTGSALLAGTSLWDNFQLAASAQLVSGSSISLLARIDERGNYISCNFDSQKVTLSEFSNSSREVLSEQIGDFSFVLQKSTQFGIKLEENSVECLVEDDVKIKDKTKNHQVPQGLIGIGTWHPIPGKASSAITNVEVQEL
jgi:peptidoglycan/xylan/chitin deacetylase (PgdA/CDA1 family)